MSAVSASIRERSWFANGAMLWMGFSKSRSKPSTAEDPNGRWAEEPSCCGPKVAQTRFAPAMAAESEGKPPAV